MLAVASSGTEPRVARRPTQSSELGRSALPSRVPPCLSAVEDGSDPDGSGCDDEKTNGAARFGSLSVRLQRSGNTDAVSYGGVTWIDHTPQAGNPSNEYAHTRGRQQGAPGRAGARWDPALRARGKGGSVGCGASESSRVDHVTLSPAAGRRRGRRGASCGGHGPPGVAVRPLSVGKHMVLRIVVRDAATLTRFMRSPSLRSRVAPLDGGLSPLMKGDPQARIN